MSAPRRDKAWKVAQRWHRIACDMGCRYDHPDSAGDFCKKDIHALARAIRRLVREEREECAKVAEDCIHWDEDSAAGTGRLIAAAIRRRGKP